MRRLLGIRSPAESEGHLVSPATRGDEEMSVLPDGNEREREGRGGREGARESSDHNARRETA